MRMIGTYGRGRDLVFHNRLNMRLGATIPAIVLAVVTSSCAGLGGLPEHPAQLVQAEVALPEIKLAKGDMRQQMGPLSVALEPVAILPGREIAESEKTLFRRGHTDRFTGQKEDVYLVKTEPVYKTASGPVQFKLTILNRSKSGVDFGDATVSFSDRGKPLRHDRLSLILGKLSLAPGGETSYVIDGPKVDDLGGSSEVVARISSPGTDARKKGGAIWSFKIKTVRRAISDSIVLLYQKMPWSRAVCSVCSGSGKGGWSTCNVCGGAGISVSKDGERHQCWKCAGAGKYQESCFECSGRGFVFLPPPEGAAARLPKLGGIPNPIRTVAVLPLVDRTGNEKRASSLRKMLATRLVSLEWTVLSVDKTDQNLKKALDIISAADLSNVPPQKIADALGVEGLLYGVLDDMDKERTGLTTGKRVRARFSILRADGSLFWGSGAGVISRLGVGGGVVASGAAAASAISAMRKKADDSVGDAESLPGGLDKIAAPWIELEERTMVAPKDPNQQQSGAAGELQDIMGLMIGKLFVGVVEKLVGEYVQVTSVMLDALIEGDVNASGTSIAQGAVVPPGLREKSLRSAMSGRDKR